MHVAIALIHVLGCQAQYIVYYIYNYTQDTGTVLALIIHGSKINISIPTLKLK